MNNNYIREIKAIIVFIIISFLIMAFLYLLMHLDLEFFFYKTIIFYLIFAGFLLIINYFIKSKILKRIVKIILYPSMIFILIFTILIPFLFLFVHLFFYLAFSFIIPEAIFRIIEYCDLNLDISQSSIIYLKLTFSVFIAVLFNYQIRKIIYFISPIKFSLKSFEIDKLSDYLLSENNIRFIIYSLYVVLLITINFKNFENLSISENLLTDKAILQSFVTFIAFERALTLLKQLEFKPSDLLNRIGNSITNTLREFDNKNNV